MPTVVAKELKKEVASILRRQGYRVKPSGLFYLPHNDQEERREEQRKAHEISKAERVVQQEDFILKNLELVKSHTIDGRDLDIDKIDPVLIEVEAGSKEEILFRWWNVIWWSLPYERAYGRQMRFVVWDKYHNAPIGLIGLQSPILNWGPRDKYLGINPEKRDYWVNQSLNAQRVGALPPYNDILGGKLISFLMTSDVIRKKFKKKYGDKKTILKKRKLPSDLLFLTTTGAYGKSSVYGGRQLKYNGEIVCKFIGYTQGTGTFHIPSALYEDLVLYLKKKGYEVERGYGNGPSRKIRIIDLALQLLGFANGISHGIKRALYIFPLASNLEDVIQKGKKPKWIRRSVKELTDFWKRQWAHPRAEKDQSYLEFDSADFISKTVADLDKYKELYRKMK